MPAVGLVEDMQAGQLQYEGERLAVGDFARIEHLADHLVAAKIGVKDRLGAERFGQADALLEGHRLATALDAVIDRRKILGPEPDNHLLVGAHASRKIARQGQRGPVAEHGRGMAIAHRDVGVDQVHRRRADETRDEDV